MSGSAPAAGLEVVWADLREALGAAGHAAARGGAALYLVGGAVRDLLLGRRPSDLDLSVEGPFGAERDLSTRLASGEGWHLVAGHERFGTVTMASRSGLRVDVAVSRRESYPVPGRLPVVNGPAPIEIDLGRRDFTIHALAWRLGPSGPTGPLIDPFGGSGDLARRTLRLLHSLSLADDPTRAIRAVRYCARLGFTLAEDFGEALVLSRRAGAWGAVSGDRLRRGLDEVLAEPGCAAAIRLLSELGVLDDIVPGWSGAPVDEAGLVAAPDLAGRWAALIGPLEPPFRVKVAARLSFSKVLSRATGVRSPA